MAGRLHAMTLRQLRALTAVARCKSVTEAADRLNLTQPAVTLQLKNLQEISGLPLLQRTPSGMVPTDAGRALLALSDRIDKALADCGQEMELLAGLSGGRVAVGAVSTAKYFAPFAMAAFSKRFPLIDLKLMIGNREEVMQGLRDFSLDVAITGRPPPDLDLEKRLIGDHPHLVVAPAGHRLAGGGPVPIAALARETMLIRERGSGTRALMEGLFQEAGAKPMIGMEISSNETIKQAVMAGLGIAFISLHTVASELRDGRLAILPVEGLPILRQWFVVRRADKVLLPPAQALMDFFGAEAGAFLPTP